MSRECRRCRRTHPGPECENQCYAAFRAEHEELAAIQQPRNPDMSIQSDEATRLRAEVSLLQSRLTRASKALAGEFGTKPVSEIGPFICEKDYAGGYCEDWHKYCMAEKRRADTAEIDLKEAKDSALYKDAQWAKALDQLADERGVRRAAEEAAQHWRESWKRVADGAADLTKERDDWRRKCGTAEAERDRVKAELSEHKRLDKELQEARLKHSEELEKTATGLLSRFKQLQKPRDSDTPVSERICFRYGASLSWYPGPVTCYNKGLGYRHWQFDCKK
jgi:hypothetical protein